MANYTPEEQIEMNKELKDIQNKLAKYIQSDKWDIIVEQLSNIVVDQICIINRAESYRDINWLVWDNMEDIVLTISKMYNKPKCFCGRLINNYCTANKLTNKGTLKSRCSQCKWNKD